VHTSYPFISGIKISSKMISGFSSKASEIPSFPEVAFKKIKSD
jgi:hypothetical protein